MSINRRKWLGDVPVSSDPRRVPVEPKADSPREAGTVIRNARVFDGIRTPCFDGDVWFEGNAIREIGEDIIVPEGTAEMDASGMTLMPGLIDLHTHLSYHEPGVSPAEAQSISDATLRALEKMRFYLESGITSVRDAGSHGDATFRLKRWAQSGRIHGPRIFPAGRLITGTGGHGAEGLGRTAPSFGKVREASGPNDWREAVRQSFKGGADVIKVASHFTLEEVSAAVDEAHALGLRVMCDAETQYVDWAIQAGVDSIEHPLPRTDAAVAQMAARGVYSVPTLIPYVIIFDQMGGYFNSTSRRFQFSREDNLNLVRKMRRAGVRFGIGTDLVLNWFRYLPYAYIRELELMTEAGFDNAEVLRMATAGGAEILDMDDRLGTIERGKLADLILVEGTPDLDLHHLSRIHSVFRDGRLEVSEGRLLPTECRALTFEGITPEDA
ncbi:MAG: amidohydrolase family protein [Bacillota bacterium]